MGPPSTRGSGPGPASAGKGWPWPSHSPFLKENPPTGKKLSDDPRKGHETMIFLEQEARMGHDTLFFLEREAPAPNFA